MSSVLRFEWPEGSKPERLLEGNASALRVAIQEALFNVTTEARDMARAAAPSAKSRAGVIAYGTGFPNNWNEKGSGSGMPRAMLDDISRTVQLAERGALITTISNQYYLGRFREEGFSGPVRTRAHTRRKAGRKSWARPRPIQKMLKSFRESYGSDSHGRADAYRMAKGYGYTDRKLRLMFNRKGGQVSVDFYERRHTVRKQPYMAPALAFLTGAFPVAMQKAMESVAWRDDA